MQKLIQGKGSLLLINTQAIPAGTKKIFLIAGEHFYNRYSLDFLKDFEVVTFRKNGPNLNGDEWLEVLETYRACKAEVIIAIGGGSVIDIGKSILFSYAAHLLQPPFFIAVPTTAGSGSEATQFAVIYFENKKQSWSREELLPKVVILDPELTYSLSPYQSAVSGMDVLAQAIESWWSLASDDASRLFASAAIQLWMQYFSDAVSNPAEEVREKMQMAAHQAGKAINITRTTGPHALSYYLTAIHQVPHGQAVSLFLPLFFLYNQPQQELCSLLKVKTEMEAKEYIQSAMKKAGLAITLEELGIRRDNVINELLDSVNTERFGNNPRPFDKAALIELITKYL
jgi:alcohol dehydrogenase class IV